MTAWQMLIAALLVVFIAYQAAPKPAGIRPGGVAVADGMRIIPSLVIISVLTLLPPNCFWWKLLGYIP